jgi:hypothetical protein
MSQRTGAFFVVSSGRSGTAMLHKALSLADGVEMHHEYMVHIVQPLAVRRYLDIIDETSTARVLKETYASAIAFSDAAHWGDSSNKVSWLIPEIAALLPRAKFVHLVRDGRKVAGSYHRKLGEECYDNRSTALLQAYYDSPRGKLPPPPEKKYWWPVPRKDDPIAVRFRSFDQFTRIAWHWAEINRVILESLAELSSERSAFVRLEDLRENPDRVEALFDFLEIPYRDEYFTAFARPHNVNRPQDRRLDAWEKEKFDGVAHDMMLRLGYAGRTEYVVNY